MQSIVKPMPEWDGYYPKKIWKYLDEQIKISNKLFANTT